MRSVRAYASVVFVVSAIIALGQPNPVEHGQLSVLNIEEQSHTCRAKGRFQDKEYWIQGSFLRSLRLAKPQYPN